MKKLVVMMALVIGSVTFAQERKEIKHDMMSTEKRVEAMTKELDLTPEQQTKMKALFDEKAKENKAKRQEMKEKMAQKKAERESHDEKIKSILTPEQVKKYEAKKEEMKKEKKEMFEKKREKSKKRSEEKLEQLQKTKQ